MDTYDPRRRQKANRARDRHSARQRRRDGGMAVPRETPRDREPASHVAPVGTDFRRYVRAGQLWVRDALWYARHNPNVWKIGLGAVASAILVFILWHVLGGKIFPNVWAANVNLGGMTVEQAEAALASAWVEDYRISLSVDGQPHSVIGPMEIGLMIDARATAEAAKAAGLAGLPFGHNVEPVVNFNYLVAEGFMLARAEEINTLPFDAGYDWVNGQVVGVPGRDGRELNVTGTLDLIQKMTDQIIGIRRFDVVTTPIPPAFVDPEPYIDTVRAITRGQFQFTSYDPFTDQASTWATAPQNVVKWLQAGDNKLVVREGEFRSFIRALNETIAAQEEDSRYIDHVESMAVVERAINAQQTAVTLRYRYKPEIYTVQRGDTAYLISRKTGIPFFKLMEVNPGRDLSELYPGDQINLPAADITLPNTPIAHKRIVVNLETQQLVAFENGEVKFQWRISSGRDSAPTSPGVYQILNHDELAMGSSYTLCANDSCGQWKMYWFMGIYEVQPGLVNGFHGAVELPNGTYLGGGDVSYPSTFGCIMSLNDYAQQLYDWAEVGTMVEIISREYQPRSELGRRVLSNQV